MSSVEGLVALGRSVALKLLAKRPTRFKFLLVIVLRFRQLLLVS
jgi:hypothetical protein